MVSANTEPRPPLLEVCDNTEWLRNHCLGVIDRDANVAAGKLSERIRDGLIAAGFDPTSPQGQRKLCYGWNGAQFAWSYGPVGTFDTPTEEQKRKIEKVVDNAKDSVRRDWSSVLKNDPPEKT
jgi:hypothetical protein